MRHTKTGGKGEISLVAFSLRVLKPLPLTLYARVVVFLINSMIFITDQPLENAFLIT